MPLQKTEELVSERNLFVMDLLSIDVRRNTPHLRFAHAECSVSTFGTSAACRPLHGLNSICAVSTRLKPQWR